jgi:hypothetical protein
MLGEVEIRIKYNTLMFVVVIPWDRLITYGLENDLATFYCLKI